MSIPSLPIDPPPQFIKDFYSLLTKAGHPFHRRGTEVSKGYDIYNLRKNSLPNINTAYRN